MQEKKWTEELDYIEPDYDLKKLLANLSKKELAEIGKKWGCQGMSQLNKFELIEELMSKITDNLESWILLLGSEQVIYLQGIIFFSDYYSRISMELDEWVHHAVEYFQPRGIVFPGRYKGNTIFLVPKKIRAKIKTILKKENVQKQINLNDKYIKYAAGSAVYYGVLTPDLLYDSLEQYMKLEGEIAPLKVILEYGYYSPIFFCDGPLFIFNMVEDYNDILVKRGELTDLNYYIPSEKEIENANKKYHEYWNLAQLRLKKMLTKEYRLAKEDAEKLICYFSLMIKNDSNTAEIIKVFTDEFEINILEEEINFNQLVNDFRNNTRLWKLKGHTPAEIIALS